MSDVQLLTPAELSAIIKERSTVLTEVRDYLLQDNVEAYEFPVMSLAAIIGQRASVIKLLRPTEHLSHETSIKLSRFFDVVAKTALNNREEQMRLFADSMPQIVWTATPDGNLDYFNNVWFTYSGTTYEQNTNGGWAQAVHTDDVPGTLVAWQTALANGSVYTNEFRLRRADGEYRWHIVRAIPVKDANGSVIRWYGTNTDIHEARLTMSRLEDSETRLTVALAGSLMGTWHIDLKTMNAVASPETNKIFGLEKIEDNIYAIISSLMHPEDSAEVNRIWEEAVRTHSPYMHEYRIVKKDGEVRWVHSRGKATYAADGTPATLSGIMMDITDRRKGDEVLAKLARDLQSAVNARDEFMSITSHELKTPVTSLKMQLQIALRKLDQTDNLPPEMIRTVLEKSIKQVDRLTKLIDDILDVSRIELQKIGLEKNPFELAVMIEDVADRFRGDSEDGTRIQTRLNAATIFSGDRFRLEQVMTNLISNALKYGNNSPVTIESTETDSDIVMKVSDQGPGIPAGKLESIFNRFERIADDKSISGLGLGLYICRQIVEQHGGTILASSTPATETVFTVRLPKSS